MPENFIIPSNFQAVKAAAVIPPTAVVANQAKLVLKNFGMALVKPKFYKIDLNRAAQESESEGIEEVGLLGLPVFDTLTIDPFSYDLEDGTTVSSDTPINFQTILIELSQPKNIVITKIQGRDKSVKEFINGGDIYINIKGSLVNQLANKRPVDEIKKLIQIKDAPIEVPVSCNLLNDFGIYSIVVMDVRVFQVEGERNVLNFEMDCIDEVPFEIRTNA